MDWRGVESSIPYSSRGGYQGPTSGWLERRGDGDYLVIGLPGGAGTATAYPPGRYLIAHPPGCNLFPRAGVRSATNSTEWAISPETVVVDFLSGYAGHPVVLAASYAANEQNVDPYLLNADGETNRVSARFAALDASTGDVLGEVKLEACTDSRGGLTVEASDVVQVTSTEADVKLTAKGDVRIAGTKVGLGPSGDTTAPRVAREGDAVSSAMVNDSTFWTWIAAIGTVLAGLGVTVPVPTSLASKISEGSDSVRAEG